MGVKSVVTRKPIPEDQFPVLMRSTKFGQIVLFSGPGVAVVLKKGDSAVSSPVGTQHTGLVPHTDGDFWELFTGTLELSNG